MLLRNYYSSLTASAIGDTNVNEDVSKDLSPRYSRKYDGQYSLSTFNAIIFSSDTTYAFSFGNGMIRQAITAVGFGSNTAEVTFNDYSPVGKYNPITSILKSKVTTYDDNTKTYTSVVIFTLTNTSSDNFDINEIMIGSAGASTYYTRDLLGENSFVLNSQESVNFELTIKYTIAEPLQ